MENKLTPSQKAALNTDIHISLTANAGSGKTFVLKKRYIKLLTRPDIFPSHIAAITFTEKAASELYNKINEELDETIQSEETPEDIKKLLRKKKRLLHSAKISTIHSFCSELIREFAIEAETDPGFIPVDEIVSSELIDSAIDSSLTQLFEEESSKNLIIELLRELKGYEPLKNLVKNAVKNRSKLQKFYSSTLADKSLEEYENEISRYIFDIFHDILEAGDPDSLKSLNTQRLLKSGLKELTDAPEFFINVLSSISPELRPSIEYDGDPVRLIRKIHLHKILFEFNRRFSTLFNAALKTYNQIKYTKGYLDYEDLILKVREMMSNPESGLSDYLVSKYRYIMIDEFQDTDEAQYDIFIVDGENLEKQKKNLFIVGDQKQSIYMFRNAEPEIFNVTQGHIQKANPEGKLTLAESFRMNKELCAFNNLVCNNMFSKVIPRFTSVEYENLVYARKEKGKTPSRIEILQTGHEGKSSDLPGQARLMAQRIIQIHNENEVTGWGEIGILLRVNKDFIHVQQALDEAGIPYHFSGVSNQFNNQFTHDIFNYFRFLADKKNSIALTGVLRSPFFMLSDTQLYALFSEDGDSLWEKLGNAATKEKSFEQIYGLLNHHLKLAASMGPGELFDTILEGTDFLNIHSAITNPSRIFYLVENLRSKIQEFENESYYTLFDLTAYLESLLFLTEKEQKVTTDKDPTSVNILTIHSSKGLEFTSVFLFNSDYVLKSSRNASLIFSKQFGIIMPLTETGTEQSQTETTFLGDFDKYLQRKKEEEEIKRLYYVALTRASDQLYILTDSIVTPPSGSLSHWVQSVCNFSNADNYKDITTEVKLLDETISEHQSEKISLRIPVISALENSSPESSSAIEQTSAQGLVETHSVLLPKKIEVIPDFRLTTERLISVSSILLYSECPYRYMLKYDLHLPDLLNFMGKKEHPLIFEADSKIPARGTEYGNIIHKGMELYQPGDSVETIITKISPEFPFLAKASELEMTKLQSDFLAVLDSKLFAEFKNEKMLNEFEVIALAGNHFVNARIDSLIIKSDSAVIIDYKTNPLEKFTGTTLQNYLLQLKIYAYLLTKLYSELHQIKTVLLTTRDPEKSVINLYSPKELEETGVWLSETLLKMVSGDLGKTKATCDHCILKEQNIECTEFFKDYI